MFKNLFDSLNDRNKLCNCTSKEEEEESFDEKIFNSNSVHEKEMEVLRMT